MSKQAKRLVWVAFAAVAVLAPASYLALYSPACACGQAEDLRKAKYVPVHDYDPKREAAADIEQALAEARSAKKNVLLEVGGKWCVWCRIMDSYFEANPDVLKLREDNYVTVKVNFSPENENKEVLSKYGEIPAYPHIFVLDAEGKLLHSQNTGELEAGKSYDKERLVGFLRKWAPSK
jgi:thiol:disulfide interchange protein